MTKKGRMRRIMGRYARRVEVVTNLDEQEVRRHIRWLFNHRLWQETPKAKSRKIRLFLLRLKNRLQIAGLAPSNHKG